MAENQAEAQVKEVPEGEAKKEAPKPQEIKNAQAKAVHEEIVRAGRQAAKAKDGKTHTEKLTEALASMKISQVRADKSGVEEVTIATALDPEATTDVISNIPATSENIKALREAADYLAQFIDSDDPNLAEAAQIAMEVNEVFRRQLTAQLEEQDQPVDYGNLDEAEKADVDAQDAEGKVTWDFKAEIPTNETEETSSNVTRLPERPATPLDNTYDVLIRQWQTDLKGNMPEAERSATVRKLNLLVASENADGPLGAALKVQAIRELRASGDLKSNQGREEQAALQKEVDQLNDELALRKRLKGEGYKDNEIEDVVKFTHDVDKKYKGSYYDAMGNTMNEGKFTPAIARALFNEAFTPQQISDATDRYKNGLNPDLLANFLKKRKLGKNAFEMIALILGGFLVENMRAINPAAAA